MLITAAEGLDTKTLSEHLSHGRMAMPDVLRFSQALAEALRKLHETGVVHGAVTPAHISITEKGLELSPAAGEHSLTPYTAPEVLAGRAVDITSDIFSFGAVVYEMVTGRRAFDGANSTELVASIVGSEPAPTGSAAIDRLMTLCLSKDPAARCQRMQRVLMELRLMQSTGKRHRPNRTANQNGMPFSDPGAQFNDVAVRNDLQHLETRLAARITTFEDRIGEIVRTTAENLAVVRAQFTTAAMAFPRGEHAGMDASAERGLARIQATLNAAMDRIGQLEETVTKSAERLQTVEEGVAASRKRLNDLHSAVADDFISFEERLKQSTLAMDSVRTAMSQTDDLVERVVDALETMQGSVVLDRPQSAVAVVN